MKILETSQKIIKDFLIDYENGIFCKYTTTNNKITSFYFYNYKKTNLEYVDDINELKKVHWNKHHEFLNKKFTVKELKKFTEFDKLYYVGCSRDGMLSDKDGNFISSVILIDMTFSKIYLKIEKKKEKCQKMIDSLNHDFVLTSNIVEIPYYNQNEYKKHHYTIELELIIPDDDYRNLLGNKEYLDDETKVKIFNFIKK